MAELWVVAYQRIELRERIEREERVFSALTEADRFLVHACYALAVVCAERDLRAAVDELAHLPTILGPRAFDRSPRPA